MDLILYIDIVLNDSQHSTTLPDHEWSFKCRKNVFLNDPKSQKKVFGHFLDLDNVFQHWATLPDHVGGPVGMNEVRIGVVGMGALGETSKSQTSRINQASNKIKCGPCRLLIGQVYLNSQSFSLNLCTRGRSGPSRSLIGQVYLTSKIFSLKLCIRGRSGPSRSLIGQVYLISQSFSLKLCIRGRSGPSRSLIGQVYLTSQSFSLKLCTRGRVVLTLTSDQLTRFIVSRFIMLLITCIEKASTEIKSGQRL